MLQPSSEQPGQPASDPPPGDPSPPAPDNPHGSPPGSPIATPSKKSNLLKVVLAVLVLGTGGVAAARIANKSLVDNINESAAKVSIVEPRTLGGRAPLTDPQFTAMNDAMERGLATDKDATNSFGALYGEVETQDVILALGVERPVFAQTAALAGAFKGLAGGGLHIAGVAPVEPGTLGGVAKCGTASTGGIDVAVCGWADEGSLGILMWYFSTADQVTAEFTELRAEIETKTD